LFVGELVERAQIHRVSVADQVATVVRQQILTGELRPGTSLQELQLASALGVSRNTMREAVRILCIEGLLRRNLHRGLAVAQLSLKDVHEIYQVRRMLELSAVAAANKPDPARLTELKAAVDDYEEAIRDRDFVRAVTADLHFHAMLIRFHKNKRLEAFYQKAMGELRMGMVLVDRVHDDPTGLVPVHREMYEFLSAGRLKECATLLAGHLEDSETRLVRVMEMKLSPRKARVT
jgi:DNA-binding GntR family transcriptional regulator